MKHSAPASLLLFVITLGLAVQLVAGVLAMQTADALRGLAVSLLGAVFTLWYAAHVSYRRGFERGQSDRHRP